MALVDSYTDSALSDKIVEFFNTYKLGFEYKYIVDICYCLPFDKEIIINYIDFTPEIKSILDSQPKEQVFRAIKRAIGEVFQASHGSSALEGIEKEFGINFKIIHNEKFENIVPKSTPDTWNLDNESEKPRDNSIEKIVEYAERIFSDSFIAENNSSKIYAIVKIDEHFETVDLDLQLAKDVLIINYQKDFRRILSTSQSEQAISFVKTKKRFSQDTPKKQIHIRCAFENDIIWYDLCNQKREIVKITKDDFAIVQYDKTCPLFFRTPFMSDQVKPNFDFKGDPISEYFKLIRKPNDIVMRSNVIALFLETVDVPMLVFGGSTDASKTVTSTLVKMLVDPSGKKIEDYGTSMPTKPDDLATILYCNYLSSFENISKLLNEQSDMLCKANTGANFSTRLFYEQGQESKLAIHRKSMLNGITVNIDRDDLGRRTLPYDLPSFKIGEKKTKEQVLSEFYTLLPDLFGHVILTLQKALILYDDVKSKAQIGIRGEFQVWGEAISQALGNPEGKFTEALQEKESLISDKLSQSNALVPFIQDLFSDGKEEYTSGESDTFDSFKDFTNGRYETNNPDVFPSSVGKLADVIKRSFTQLNNAGFTIEIRKSTKKETHNGKTYNSNVKFVTIKKIKEVLFE